LQLKHRCNILDHCFLTNGMKLLFCSLCRTVRGFETPEGEVMLGMYKQNELSEQSIRDSV